jgi:hypothetical protein
MSSLVLELIKVTLEDFLAWGSSSVAVIAPFPPRLKDHVSFEMLTNNSHSQPLIFVTLPEYALPVRGTLDVSITLSIQNVVPLSVATEIVESFERNIRAE